jgi:hypothetical protein
MTYTPHPDDEPPADDIAGTTPATFDPEDDRALDPWILEAIAAGLCVLDSESAADCFLLRLPDNL